jgi:hypothetical protein
MEKVENSAGYVASREEMTMRPGTRQRRVTTPEREALRGVIHECEAFVHWAAWCRPAERSRRSIIQMLGIIRKVALGGLRRRRK